MTLVFAGPFGEIRGAGDIALQPVLSCVCATSLGRSEDIAIPLQSVLRAVYVPLADPVLRRK